MKEFKEISEKSPFKVPENYFEEVNRKIITSTSGYGSMVKEKNLYRKLIPYLAVAASVALLTLLSYTTIYVISSGRNKPIMPEISLNEFSDNYFNDIDILTLEQNAGSIDPDIAQLNINSNDIIDYLLFENIEINVLHEQL
jgi:hypothetical protein